MTMYNEVLNAKTVVWNGPMGVFENPTLAKGTNAVAEALAKCEGTTIIGVVIFGINLFEQIQNFFGSIVIKSSRRFIQK